MIKFSFRPRAFMAALTATLGATLVMGSGTLPTDYGRDAALRLPPSLRSPSQLPPESLRLPSPSLATAATIRRVQLASTSPGPWIPPLRPTPADARQPEALLVEPTLDGGRPIRQEQPTAIRLTIPSDDPQPAQLAPPPPVNKMRLTATLSPS